jgi:hypothetical protein
MTTRIFHIALGAMNVTVHPTDDFDAIRVLQPVPLTYFIDGHEVDLQTFDRELDRCTERHDPLDMSHSINDT